ncbi:MAG: putative rane protein [Bacteroidetes bacterium]|nr:putative rane protein [Bacteroidota bacterium]
MYAYRFRLASGYLSFGLQGGVDSYTSNWHRVHTIESNDPGFASNMQRTTLPNAGAGTYYYSQRFFLGLAAPDLVNGSLSKYRTTILHSGYLINASDNFKIKPAVLVKYIFNSPLSANVSSTFYWKDIIGLGVGYTLHTSALAFVDLKINDQMRFGYGYDYTMTKLKTYSSGSHEVMLRYLFRYKVEPLSTRYF